MSTPPSFLYVEDDFFSIQVMKAIFDRVMHQQNLAIYQNGQSFLNDLETLNPIPDIFLLDIQMKPYNGFELLRIIRKQKKFRKSKVVALTASVMGEEVDRLKESGFEGAISKPINMSSFPELIERILKGESIWFVS